MTNDILQKAIELNLSGYNVVFAPPGHATRVRWGKWQTDKQTVGDVLAMLKYPGHTNLCIITGYNGETVLDFDTQTEYEIFYNAHPTFCDTYTVKTNRGFHLHYTLTDTSLKFTHPLCEVWTGGHFAALPGAQHKTGTHYKRLGNAERKHITINDLFEVGCSIKSPRKEERCNTGAPSLFTRRVHAGSICDKIKSQIHVVDIIGPCDFETSGQHHAMGYCPFHNDSERSLSLHLQSNRVKCFAENCIISNSWHSVIDLYMKKHNCDLKTALRKLSKHVN